jgi:hypothetical protein
MLSSSPSTTKKSEIVALFGIINHWNFHSLTFNGIKQGKTKEFYENLLKSCDNFFFIKKEDAQHHTHGYYQNRIAEFHLLEKFLQKDPIQLGTYRYTGTIAINDIYQIYPSYKDYFLKKYSRFNEGIKSPFYAKKTIPLQDLKSTLLYEHDEMMTIYAVSHTVSCTYKDIQLALPPALESLPKFINNYFATYKKAQLKCETIGYYESLHLCIIQLEIPMKFMELNTTSDVMRGYTYIGPELTENNIKKIHPFYPHYLRSLSYEEQQNSAELKKMEALFQEGISPQPKSKKLTLPVIFNEDTSNYFKKSEKELLNIFDKFGIFANTSRPAKVILEYRTPSPPLKIK